MDSLTSRAAHRSGLILVGLLAVGGCSADLATKRWVFEWLGPPPSSVFWIWKDYVGLETSINQGALFGIGQGQLNALSLVSIVAIIAIVAWLTTGKVASDRLLAVALGLILGGIVGNLHDRLGLWGSRGVRDWILFKYRDFIWPNFNVADSLLVCGALLMAWHSLRTAPVRPTADTATGPSPP